MESSSRMRRCLRRNYRGSDHFGAAANYDDHINTKEDQENAISSSSAPILAAEAISMGTVNEDDDHVEIDHLDGRADGIEQNAENQSGLSVTAEQTIPVSVESGDIRLANDQDLVESSSPAAAGYFPSELDERIVLELSSSMVRPLRVIRGTFQVSLLWEISGVLSFKYIMHVI